MVVVVDRPTTLRLAMLTARINLELELVVASMGTKLKRVGLKVAALRRMLRLPRHSMCNQGRERNYQHL